MIVNRDPRCYSGNSLLVRIEVTTLPVNVLIKHWSAVAASLLSFAIVTPSAAVEMTFYGNQHFKFVSDEGMTIADLEG